MDFVDRFFAKNTGPGIMVWAVIPHLLGQAFFTFIRIRVFDQDPDYAAAVGVMSFIAILCIHAVVLTILGVTFFFRQRRHNKLAAGGQSTSTGVPS